MASRRGRSWAERNGFAVDLGVDYRGRPKGKTRSVKKSKPGDRYGALPHQRMPRKGEL